MLYFSAMLVRSLVPDGRGGMLILRLAACRRLLLAVCGLNILLLTVSRLRLLSLNSLGLRLLLRAGVRGRGLLAGYICLDLCTCLFGRVLSLA